MDRSVFVLLLLSGLFWSSSAQYHFINVRMSWSEAQSYCRERSTDLVTVDAMEDVDGLMNAVDAGFSGSVWIGLKRGTQKRWGWSNGEDSQYFNWVAGEPNGDGECAPNYSGNWYDQSCSYNRYFVCYKKNSGYSVILSPRGWSGAQSYCRQYYTDLVTIHNSVENRQIADMKPGWYLWTGLFQDSWEWSDKSSRFFRYWAAGQPSQSSGSDDCAAMSTTDSGKWSQYSCNLQYPFICYGAPKSLTYHFVNKNVTWSEAQSYCRARFIDLAEANTMNDVSRLVNAVDSGYTGSVWIGLHNGTGERWVWSMGGSSLSKYSVWSPGEPSGDGECVMSFGGGWFDETCSSVFPFVCFSDIFGFVNITTPMTWRDAQSYCRQNYIDLASISSAEQQNLISPESQLWIGLFLDSWDWSDKWSLSFRYWAADQPSQKSVSGECVGMSATDSGKWSQYSCDLQQPFICFGDDDKLIKKQTVRLELSCNGECALNDPSLQTAILNEINEKLKIMGLKGDSKISWRQKEGEEVFHKEKKITAVVNSNCKGQF